jgi:hypothetical protein
MALLDLSEVLNDPLFTSSIRLINRVETTDENGNPVWEERVSAEINAVVTADIHTIERLPEALRRTGSILVRYLAQLAPEGFTATGFDSLEYRGRRYTVKDKVDYSHFGEGMIRLICIPEDVVDDE